LIRYFIIVLGATHSSFTIVVAAFIFGIGLGSLLVSSKLVGMTPLPTLLTSIFALTAGFMGVGLLFFGRVPFEISRAMSIFAPTPLAWPAYEFLRFGICFMLMLPITLASGMILPICVRIAGRGVVHIGRDVAMVYAASTMAALLGVLVTSQLLIRIFTLPHTLQFIMFIYVITAISLAFVLKEKGKKRIFAFIWILILAHISFWRPWSPDSLFVDRLNFVKYPYLDYKDFQQTNQTHVIVEERQGPEVQVVVMDVLNEIGSLCRSMYINGKPDASNDPFGPDLETEILLGQLPMLLHPAPANVFVLGVGSGITSGESLNHPAVRKVTTVELAEEVFEAAKNFANDNHRFWENPKHRIVIDDGKNFLALTKEKFDVIAMEPTNIWQEGMAGLFSEDFFRLVKSRLADGGIVAQWLHTYKVDDLSLNIVLKSFSRVFPKASIFSTSNGGDILLVGYDENWKFDALKMEHDFYRPGIWEPMRKAGNYSVVDVLLREMMSRESFREYTEALEVPINTENFPVLEYAAEFAYFMRQPSSLLEGRDSRLDTDNDDLLLHLFFKQLEPNPVQWRKLLDSNILVRNLRLKNSLLFKLLNMSGPEEQQKTLLPRLDDPLLKEVFLHPNYRRDPAEMSKDEIYYRLGGDLLIWSRAASQIWTPSFERMQKMYSMLATGEDPRQDGLLALKIAINLGQERSCGAALYFFRQAEAAGVMTAANMNEFDVSTAFTCEVKEGDLQRALTFWKVIAENGFVVLDETRLAKNILNIKLGGEPPPPYYGRLPERF
jgi:predicted membrane-bound spermidine synthase